MKIIEHVKEALLWCGMAALIILGAIGARAWMLFLFAYTIVVTPFSLIAFCIDRKYPATKQNSKQE